MSLNEKYNYLMEVIRVSEETLQVITCINGWNDETLEDVLFCLTGERSFPDDENEEEE